MTAPLVIPNGGSLEDLIIRVPQGRSLAFVGQPMNGFETLKDDITLESDRPDIARAFSTPEMNDFTVIGVDTGLTALRVIDNSGQVTSTLLSVQVTAP